VSPLLEVTELAVRFPVEDGTVRAVDGASWSVERGRTLAIVGESGSGKSVSALSVMGLVTGAEVAGRALLEGTDLLALPRDELRRLRGDRIAMVFQDPLSSLHPLKRVGTQIAEAVRAHRPTSRAAASARTLELLAMAGVPDPAARARSYPHELSGGMRQRAMIAMALANEPDVLLADEPTTALDVTVQAQILDLLVRLQSELGTAIVLIAHDLAVVAGVADEVAVMHAGRVVESATRDRLFAAPAHPQTRRLLEATPRLDAPRPRGAGPSRARHGEPLLEVRDLAKRFPPWPGLLARAADPVRAVDGISFDVAPGEALGIVGESGSGKSTTARLIVRLLEPDAGSIRLGGDDITRLSGRRLASLRSRMQIVFQDPYSSLNPRKPVGAAIGAPLALRDRGRDAATRRRRVEELMEQVGLDPDHRDRYPHELSGGERQRVALARALAPEPQLLVADEPVSALDVSIQAEILRLLERLRGELGLTLVLISHDLAVVRQACERVAVMRDGKIVELAAADSIYEAPEDPYTRELLAAVPRLPRAVA
jgi:peptide/nickel transport system ATP-binding protein